MSSGSTRIALALLGLSLFGNSAHAQTAATAPIALSVDASQKGPTIDRHLFGQFAEHLGNGIYEGVWVGPDSPIPNTRGIRNDVVAALKALKVPNVRWPGGCFADEYHWRKGIGPRRSARATLNPNWGGVIEPNTFGTHEFMDFVDQIGSRGLPLGQRRLGHAAGSGRVAGVPDHRAADGAGEGARRERPCRRPTRSPILGIGNESWDCGGNMSPEYYLSQLQDLQPLRPELQSGAAAGREQDAEDRRRPGRRRAAVDRVDRDDHEGLEGPPVELGHGRPVAAQLHGGALAAGLQVGRVRRDGVRADPASRRWRWTA